MQTMTKGWLATPPAAVEVADIERMALTFCRVIAPLGIMRLLGLFDNSALPADIQPAVVMVRNQNRLCRSAIQESDAIPTSAAQLAIAESLGDMPLVVLSHGKPPSPDELPPGQNIELMEEMLVVWRELQEELAAKSSNSSHFLAEESGHYIHLEQPQLVIDAINQVVIEVPGE